MGINFSLYRDAVTDLYIDHVSLINLVLSSEPSMCSHVLQTESEHYQR